MEELMESLAAETIQTYWKQRQDERSHRTVLDQQRAMLRKEFDEADTSGDGTLDTEEIGQLLKSLGEDLTPAELRAHIKAVDVDASGELDFEEFVELIESWQNRGASGLGAPEAQGSASNTPPLPSTPAARSMPALPQRAEGERAPQQAKEKPEPEPEP